MDDFEIIFGQFFDIVYLQDLREILPPKKQILDLTLYPIWQPHKKIYTVKSVSQP
jgi:hypothetical protein